VVLQLNRVGNRNHLDEEEEEKVVERKREGDSWDIAVTSLLSEISSQS